MNNYQVCGSAAKMCHFLMCGGPGAEAGRMKPGAWFGSCDTDKDNEEVGGESGVKLREAGQAGGQCESLLTKTYHPAIGLDEEERQSRATPGCSLETSASPQGEKED